MLLVKNSNTHETILHFVYGYNHMYENKNFHGKETNLDGYSWWEIKPWLLLDYAQLGEVPTKVTIRKSKRSWLGSLVIHLFENYYIKGLLLICLAISRSLSEKLGSNYDCFTCITLFRETKFSNASNLKLFLKFKAFLLSSLEDQCTPSVYYFWLMIYLYSVYSIVSCMLYLSYVSCISKQPDIGSLFLISKSKTIPI